MHLVTHSISLTAAAQLLGRQSKHASYSLQECHAMALQRALPVLCSAMRNGTARSQQPEQTGWIDIDFDNNAEQTGVPNWGGYNQSSQQVNLSATPSPQLINAMDKNRLKPHLRHELARRLRREAPELGMLTGRMRVLRLFRFAIDDLQLYKAIHDADMEGRLVVVDDPKQAHVVLATSSTRTGRDVVLDNAKNLAANLGIPFIKLDRVSGIQLMTALSPIMGLPIPEHLLERKVPPRPVLQTKSSQMHASMLLKSLQPATDAAQRASPGLHKECDAEPSIAEILQGSQESSKHGKTVQQQIQSNQTSVHGTGRTVSDFIATNHVSVAHTAVEPEITSVYMTNKEDSQDSKKINGNISDFDVDDSRHSIMPSNPTARLGSRNVINRPIKHGRLAKLRKARKEAALEDVPW